MSNVLNILEADDLINQLIDEVLDLNFYNTLDSKWAFQYVLAEELGHNARPKYWAERCLICFEALKGEPDRYKRAAKCEDHYRRLTIDHLRDHFSAKAFKVDSKIVKVALGVSLNLRRSTQDRDDGICRVLVIDFDNEDAVTALREKITPYCREAEIDYMVECGPGELSKEKAHIWFRCEDTNWAVGHLFLCALLDKCGVNEDERKRLKLELFPRKNSYIRLFGGLHCKINAVYPCIRNKKKYTEPLDILRQFLQIEKLEKEYIEQFVLENTPEEKKVDRIKRSKRVHVDWKYIPKNLPIPEAALKNITPEMKTILSGCNAMNKTLELAYDPVAQFLGKDSDHEPGLMMCSAAVNLDGYREDDANVKWIQDILKDPNVREQDRDTKEQLAANAWINYERPYFNNCKNWATQKLCGDCTYRNHDFFTSPKQVLFGAQIKKTKIKDVRLANFDQIRARVKDILDNRVSHYVRTGERKDIVLAHPPGSGKSYLSDEMAANLAREGFNVVIAVQSAEMAQQHKNRLEQLHGIKPFIVNSREQLFKRNKDGSSRITGIDIPCPNVSEMKRLETLGVSSKTIKSKFCKRCPFNEECPYPGQYAKAADPKHNIVIIQHAHFSCQETLFTLFSEKQFDCMIVDEEFINSTYKTIKPNELEIERLKERQDNYPWVAEIVKWLEGGYAPTEKLDPSEDDLEAIKIHIESHGMPWNMKTYIMYHNQEQIFDKNIGLFLFHPIPFVPVRVFTDATPPVEMLKIVLDSKDIEVFGEEEVLDYKHLNPETEIIQVLDSATSKSALSKDEYALFYEWLEYIGDDVRKNHKDKKVLITTYQNEGEMAHTKHNFMERAREWLGKNYPDIFINSEIIISWMAIGTNEFASCQVQYQLAGLHYNARDLYVAAYELKSIANYWNRLNARPLLQNMFPYGVTPTTGYPREKIPLMRVEIDPVEGPGLYRYPFNEERPWEEFYDVVPANWYMYLVFLLSLAKRQQAMRIIRGVDNLPRKVVIMDKSNRTTQAVSKSILVNEELGYIRKESSK